MNRKDLSYDGVTARRRQGLLNNISNINADLKYERLRVVLEPGETFLNIRWADQDGRRYKRSPKGVDLSPHGVETARRLAMKIGNAVREGYYTEEWYQSNISGIVSKVDPDIPLLWGEVLRTFAEKWSAYRCGDKSSTERQKQITLTYYLRKLKSIDDESIIAHDTEFDQDAITRILSTQSEGSDKRFRYRESMSLVCSLYGVSYNFKGIGKRPKPARREIPTDELIVTVWESFATILDHPLASSEVVLGYRWLYSVLAAYGLRPQELFAIDLSKSFQPENDYWLCLDEKLMDGLKTGNRWVAPLHPEWVAKFEIEDCKYPPLADSYNSKSRSINRYFASHKFPFLPYDLRHAYAIRCRKLGIELLDAADLMGHDPAMHSKTYQRWMGQAEKIASVRAALNRNK